MQVSFHFAGQLGRMNVYYKYKKIYIGFATETEVCDGDQRLFVMEASTFDDLCVSLSQPCECSGRWKLHSTKQVSY